MSRPLAIDIFAGLGGWTEGLLSAGYETVGFDIEQHVYGDHRYPAQLVLQDVTTLHGSQFKDAALIVASPPCQEFSYMAMPWKRAKQIAVALRGQGEFPDGYKGSRTIPELTRLFDACFRIQREAIEAAGHFIPLVVENVRGAQPWVGKAKWNFGSYYLWGDVPALMPLTIRAEKFNPDGTQHGAGSWFAVADSENRGARSSGTKVAGMNWSNYSKPDYKAVALNDPRHHATKTVGHVNQREHDAVKHGGEWFSDPTSPSRQGGTSAGSKSPARKMASAMIAKIPLSLSTHIARTYCPR